MNPIPQPQTESVVTRQDNITLGIVNNYADTEETRLFLTPEACAMIANFGYRILVESGAGININYPDKAYADAGAVIVTRTEALKSDIVLSVRPLHVDDLLKMRKGTTLISLMDSALFDRAVVEALLDRNIIMIALDKVVSANGLKVFARILDEIDGRAAIIYAQEGLTFLGEGKGVLLAGVAGLNPCEVVVIGCGWRPQAAAKAAMAAGARVTMMDNDVSSLFEAQSECGDNLATAVIHPHVLFNKVKSADVIILDDCTNDFEIPRQLGMAMKESVYMLDMRKTIPSLCVPRTVAMGLSNPLVHFFGDVALKGGIERLAATTPGVRPAIVTLRGKLVDKYIAMHLGLCATDISVMLTQTN